MAKGIPVMVNAGAQFPRDTMGSGTQGAADPRQRAAWLKKDLGGSSGPTRSHGR